MSGHAWAEIGAVVFVGCGAGLWASVLSGSHERRCRRAEQAREAARLARAATYKPMPDPDWLKEDRTAAPNPTPRR